MVSFTNEPAQPTMERHFIFAARIKKEMPLSGEAIRLMNYIDDVTVTLRRVLSLTATLSDEDKKKVTEHLKSAKPNVSDVLAALETK